jgi:hypothetical protein
VPMPEGPRVELGKMRSKNDSYKRLCTDLAELGLRHRRGHDLRRTMISLTRTDGARKDLLELCTHTPKSRAPSTSIRSSLGNRCAGKSRSSRSSGRLAERSSRSSER